MPTNNSASLPSARSTLPLKPFDRSHLTDRIGTAPAGHREIALGVPRTLARNGWVDLRGAPAARRKEYPP